MGVKRERSANNEGLKWSDPTKTFVIQLLVQRPVKLVLLYITGIAGAWYLLRPQQKMKLL